MQYYENSAAVMNVKMIESLITSLMRHHLQLSTPESVVADKKSTRTLISINFFLQKIKYFYYYQKWSNSSL
jgi:hypothetical protein